MAFNINTFRSSGLVFGGVRPSLFEVTLSPPTALGFSPEGIRKLTFTAQASSIPESALQAIEVPYFGRKIKIAGDRTFADWRVTIMNDEDFSVRSMFEKWSNALNRHVNNVRQADLVTNLDYKADMEVIQYSKTGPENGDGQGLRSYRIVGAFPTTVDAMELDWNTTNQVQTFNVTIAYDYWEPNNEAGIGPGVNPYRGEL